MIPKQESVLYPSKMKRFLPLQLLLILIFSAAALRAQTGIGTRKPDESAVLDISSKSKGLLFPRMSTAERDLIRNPATGLLIFNTSLNQIEYNSGNRTSPNWMALGGTAGTELVGKTGLTGDKGATGESAFESWQLSNPNGTDADFIASMIGIDGQDGANGLKGDKGDKGDDEVDSPVLSVSKDYRLKTTDSTIFCDTENKAFTLYLPDASGSPGKVFVISKIDETANELNIIPPILLSKKTSISFLNYPKSFRIKSDGSAWYIIN